MLQQIEDRFRHYPPRNQEEIEAHEMIRREFSGLALELTRSLPESVTTSREFALTLTYLEIAMFCCNAAYARNKINEEEIE